MQYMWFEASPDLHVRADEVERNKTKGTTLRPVGFEPTRFGETVGLKSTPLDHSGRSAYFDVNMKKQCNTYYIK